MAANGVRERGGTAAADLAGLIQAIVRDQLASIRVAELAVVTDVFPHADASDQNNYACTVKLRDTGVELPRVPVATGRIGAAAIPNVDDLVLVTFVGGSIHAPVIVGRLYDDTARPPEAKARECVYESVDAAESGVRRAALTFPNGNTLVFDDDHVVVEMGGTKLTLNNGGDVAVESKGKVTISSSGATEVKAGGDLKLDASGAVTIKAGGDMKIEGLSVSVKAQTTAKLEGGASTSVKGALVTVAGTTSFSPG
jgi:phage baseplate assembly protein gpV